MAFPEFMKQEDPPPEHKTKRFKGRLLPVVFGMVSVDKVEGWVENPRIKLEIKEMQLTVGTRDLTQDEIYDIMKTTRDVELAALRDDIAANGIKEPIVLSQTGRLLDGNRRYFALKYLLETLPASDPNRGDFEVIPAFVLGESTTSDDEELVVREENFSLSLKIPWKDYVKANFIREDHEAGMAVTDIADKYTWKRAKVKETMKIIDLIDEFKSYASDPEDPSCEHGGGLGLSETETDKIVSEQYQYFNEAQRSFLAALHSDIDFKIQFFKWIKEKKFHNFPEVRIAHSAYSDPEALSRLMDSDPKAAKDAKTILDHKKRKVRAKGDGQAKIVDFCNFLQDLTAEEINALPAEIIALLKGTMALVSTMAESTQPNDP